MCVACACCVRAYCGCTLVYAHCAERHPNLEAQLHLPCRRKTPKVHETILGFERAEAAAKADAAAADAPQSSGEPATDAAGAAAGELRRQLEASERERDPLQRRLDGMTAEAEATLASLAEALSAATDEVERLTARVADSEGRLSAALKEAHAAAAAAAAEEPRGAASEAGRGASAGCDGDVIAAAVGKAERQAAEAKEQAAASAARAELAELRDGDLERHAADAVRRCVEAEGEARARAQQLAEAADTLEVRCGWPVMALRAPCVRAGGSMVCIAPVGQSPLASACLLGGSEVVQCTHTV